MKYKVGDVILLRGIKNTHIYKICYIHGNIYEVIRNNNEMAIHRFHHEWVDRSFIKASKIIRILYNV